MRILFVVGSPIDPISGIAGKNGGGTKLAIPGMGGWRKDGMGLLLGLTMGTGSWGCGSWGCCCCC